MQRPRPERTVSTSSIVVWALWAASIIICITGAAIVLVAGTHIWARAVGLALFGLEMLFVSAAAVATARLLLRRHDARVEDRLELREDITKLRQRR